MEVALYHPAHGYYRSGKDRFGRGGDYFTAEQMQPVFGALIAARIRQLHEELGRPAEFAVVELGAGRKEMAEAFAGFRYYPVETGGGEWPERFTGVVFSNEFFDALPVDAAVRRGGEFRELLVGWRGEGFAWEEGPPLDGAARDYALRYYGGAAEGVWIEIALEALAWLERAAARLERGFVLTIDYGYLAREWRRFPQGTLMSYRSHRASEDVLIRAGEQDITAHVNFSALEEHGARCGLETVRYESMAQTLFAAGAGDNFAAALEASSPAERLARRLQLKTLLFGMGETFRTLLQRKL